MATQHKFTATIEHTIDAETIATLLVSAFEGGSNYWMRSVKRVNRSEDFYDVAPFASGLVVVDGETGTEHRLDVDAIRSGLKTMATSHPRHMADVLKKNDDATTGDVFLQCCLFGEVVYG